MQKFSEPTIAKRFVPAIAFSNIENAKGFRENCRDNHSRRYWSTLPNLRLGARKNHSSPTTFQQEPGK